MTDQVHEQDGPGPAVGVAFGVALSCVVLADTFEKATAVVATAGNESVQLPSDQVRLAAHVFNCHTDLVIALQGLLEVTNKQRWGQSWPGRPHAQTDAAEAALAKATGAQS